MVGTQPSSHRLGTTAAGDRAGNLAGMATDQQAITHGGGQA